jgi:hypothetical protein
MGMAALAGSQALFTLTDDPPPCQGAWQCTQQSSQSTSQQMDPFWAFTFQLSSFGLQVEAGSQEITTSGCIELLCELFCFHLASYFNRLSA